MKLATLEQLNESLEGLDNSSPDSLNKLVGDMLKAFEALESQIESDSPMEREQALHIALGLKAALENNSPSFTSPWMKRTLLHPDKKPSNRWRILS